MKRLLLTLIILLTVLVSPGWAQSLITGKVLDDKGQGIPGAGVSVKGSPTIGAATDVDGNFQLSVPGNTTTLVVQAGGYATQEVSAANAGNIRMATAARELSGAVVTALSIRREKRELGYAATTISNEELTSGNNVSALSAIQGKTAGANITSSTGGPGGSTRVVLRGEKSITGSNNALIVVDGVITNNGGRLEGNSSLEQIDFGNRGNDVNPDDIESITVLKGPAAAALYGSQGANGAIMITTKSGKNRKGNRKTEISFSSTYTLSNVLKLPTLQNEYGQGNVFVGAYPDDRRENFSWGLPYDNQLRPWGQIIDGKQQVKPYSALKNNIRDFYNTGKTTENYLSLAGGNEKSTFFLSLNTLNNTGVIPNTFYDKYSVRFNATTELSNKFYSTVSLNYVNIASRVEATGQATGSVTGNLNQTPRDIPVTELANLDNIFNSYGAIDAQGVARYGYYGAYEDNPYWIAKNYDNRSKTDRILGAVTIGYHGGSHFNIFNRVSGDIVSDRFTQKTPKYSYVAFDDFWADNPKNNNGGFAAINTNSILINNDLIATYNKDLSEDFNIDALAGYNFQLANTSLVSGEIDPSSNGLVQPGFYNLQNNQGPVTSINNTSQTRQFGFYGSVNIGYKRRLFLGITGRNDITSTLIPQNRSFFYPSVTGSWVFTEGIHNGFTRNILNYGKIRASYASVGNGAPAYGNNNPGYVTNSVSTGFGTTTFPFNSTPAFTYQNFIPDNSLRPERTNSWEVGTELSFFKSRLSVEASYYVNNSIDQILTTLPVAPSSGFTSQVLNVGEIQNKGIELSARVTPVSTRTGFVWELYGTYYHNESEVVSLSNGVSQITLGGYSGLSIVAQVGKPYGAMYAIDVLRDNAGHVIVDTTTGIPLRTNTTVFKGTFQPKFIASWGTNLRFKGFTFNVLFNTKQGGYFYSQTKRNLDFNGTAVETAEGGRDPRIWENSVYDDGTGHYVANTKYKYSPYNFYTNDAQTFSGIHIVDASYIKIQEASLYYSLPSKWFKSKYISGVTVGVFGNNLFIWTASDNKYTDPEMNSGGATNEQGFEYEARPSLRNYGASLKVNF